MAQKVCCNCQKELSPTERALGEIQCTGCYQHWLYEIVPSAEPIIRRILDELAEERERSQHPVLMH